MKSKWLIALAVMLAAFGFGLVGCGGGGGGGGDDEVFYVSLASDDAPLELTLGNNFQYGDGYQGQLDGNKLNKGYKVTEGDTFFLKVTFKSDRALEAPLWVGLVNTTKAVNFWGPLTWDGSNEDDEGGLVAPADKLDDPSYVIPENTEITAFIEMVALKSAPSSAADENVMNFQTEGEPSPGNLPHGDEGSSGNTGIQGPAKLTFTEFVFARDTAWDPNKVPGFVAPEPTPKLTITVGGTDQEVDPILVGSLEANTEEGIPAYSEVTLTEDKKGYLAPSKGYGNAYVYFKVNLGADKDISNFTGLTVTFTGGTGDTTAGSFSGKNAGVIVSETAITGYKNFPSEGVGSVSVGGTSGNPVTIEFDNDSAIEDVEGVSEVYVGISIHAGDGTYTISNITFNAAP